MVQPPVTLEAALGLIILVLLMLVVWLARLLVTSITGGRWVPGAEHERVRQDLAQSEERNDRLQETLATEIRSLGTALDQVLETQIAQLQALPRPRSRTNGPAGRQP